jgi:hypothetical protein
MHTRIVTIAAAMLLSPLVASAQEYCVTCKGPDASYRCVIGGDATVAARNSRGQFLCITELAKAGGHSSCSAARGQATPCPGETRTVMFSLGDPGASPLEQPTVTGATPPGQLAPVETMPATPLAPPAPAPAHTTAPVEEKKPNAVEDLANKTGKAVTDTGEAVGGAMKKTWDCVASLFGKC